jgi:putative hydrolase of the HAD superfamily
MNDPIVEILRRLARPLAPEPTGEAVVLRRLEGIQALLFDVYGTLFISASGDIGATAGTCRGGAFTEAAALCGLVDAPDGEVAASQLEQVIRGEHERARAEGVEFPEVDIVEVWRTVFVELGRQAPDDAALQRFAAVYENLVNPVWSMPGCRETLERLRAGGLRLGVLSNAQFYTPPLFQALLGAERASLGIEPGLEFYSFQIKQAKPGRALYERACEALKASDVEPSRTLFIGNDMLNDIAAAAAVGFRTALFAGDRRSLRKREGDSRVAGVVPDVVITELPQLLDVVGIAGASVR